ncbi:hypothetical protein R3I94_000757 [Phoxinus phoxinus]
MLERQYFTNENSATTDKDVDRREQLHHCEFRGGLHCTAFMIFLTIPVTVASAERSFSKLKLIKSYLRSSMGQSRLSGLAILSIENARARYLDLYMIDSFAQRKARKMQL